MKFKLSSWEKGEQFMQVLASTLDLRIETRDARQLILLSSGKVTFHPDNRGFAFITAKGVDQGTLDLITTLQKKFSNQ
jgi:hypothetical protein